MDNNIPVVVTCTSAARMVWQEEMDQIHNIAEVIVAKQRHGPAGKTILQFNALLTKFSNLAKTNYIPEDTYYSP